MANSTRNITDTETRGTIRSKRKYIFRKKGKNKWVANVTVKPSLAALSSFKIDGIADSWHSKEPWISRFVRSFSGNSLLAISFCSCEVRIEESCKIPQTVSTWINYRPVSRRIGIPDNSFLRSLLFEHRANSLVVLLDSAISYWLNLWATAGEP